ncbi:hypothetical protein H4Q26_017230 [Puccinia striiformis f. sp. tritici PST-130]|nr:hypothetical protein H4Q26_017230 [Puccinia striiformis f. sp. tritici PST-130]
MTTRSSKQNLNQQESSDPDSGSDSKLNSSYNSEPEIAIVSTANHSQIEPGIANSRLKTASQPAGAATLSSNSNDPQRKTTSDIWAHFNQSG